MEKVCKALYILLLLCSTRYVAAQSIRPFVFNATGGVYDDVNSYFRYEWSIGELTLIDIFAKPDSLVVVTQGLLQPCTDIITRSFFSTLFAPGEFRLFPNPTRGKFELDFFVRENGKMELTLTDNFGKILETRHYDYNGCCRIEYFDLTRYPAGTYFVIANLSPDRTRPGDGATIIRHSGIRVVRIND